MNRLHPHRALPNGGRDALHRATPRRASPAKKTPGRLVSSSNGARSSDHPEHEQAVRRRHVGRARVHVLNRAVLEVPLAVSCNDGGARAHGDVRGASDAVDEVLGHCLLDRRLERENRHVPRVLREQQRRLSRGVATIEDEDLLVATGGGLGARGSLVNSRAHEQRAPRSLEPPEADAKREQDRARRKLGPVIERHETIHTLGAQPCRLARDDDLDAKSLRLLDGVPRQIASAQRVGKAGIALDAHAETRLATRDFLLDDDRSEPLRRGVDRGREASRPAAHDDEIVEAGIGEVSSPSFSATTGTSGSTSDEPSGNNTTGLPSPPDATALAAILWASASFAESNRTYGTRLREKNVWSSCMRGDHRLPTTRTSPSTRRGCHDAPWPCLASLGGGRCRVCCPVTSPRPKSQP